MTTTYSNETKGVLDGTLPPALGDAGAVGAKTHVTFATIGLAAQAIGDQIVLGDFDVGTRPRAIIAQTDTSLGAATLSVGTVASPAKYRAAATLTALDTPSSSMKTATVGQPLSVKERWVATIAGAALPAAGNLLLMIEHTIPHSN